MDDKTVSPEELAAEQAATSQAKEDEVRASIIEEYGFDESNDEERISKLVSKEMDHRKKLSDAIGQKRKWRDLAHKPESKETKVETPVGELSTKDVLLLAKADVHEDDIDEVVEYSRFKKIPIAEAMKSDFIKTLLSNKSEERKTAEATSAGNGRRVTQKTTGDAVLERARTKGELPDDGDLDKMLDARWDQKKARK